MNLMPCVQDFGGVKLEMKERFTGKIEGYYVNPKKMVAWVFAT